MIIIQVINKVFIVFFSPEEILLHTDTFSISTPFLKNKTFMVVKFTFFNLNITKGK